MTTPLQRFDSDEFNRQAFGPYEDHMAVIDRDVQDATSIVVVPQPRAQVDYDLATQCQQDLAYVRSIVQAMSGLSTGNVDAVDLASHLFDGVEDENTNIAAFDGGGHHPV